MRKLCGVAKARGLVVSVAMDLADRRCVAGRKVSQLVDESEKS